MIPVALGERVSAWEVVALSPVSGSELLSGDMLSGNSAASGPLENTPMT